MRRQTILVTAAVLSVTGLQPAASEAKYRDGDPPQDRSIGTRAEAWGAIRPNQQYDAHQVDGQDWFYFYLRRTTRVTLRAQNYTPNGDDLAPQAGQDGIAECVPLCTARFEIRDARGQRGDAVLLDGYDTEFGEPKEGRSTVRLRPGRYYVRLSGIDGQDADGQYLAFSVNGRAAAFSGRRPR